MTSEQAKWLERNPQFRPVGKAGGHVRYLDCGLLHTDGTFQDGPTVIAAPEHNSPAHDIIVGRLEVSR